jgi:DNA transformation protein and related proteins
VAPGANDHAHIGELFSAFGPVVVRRLFGGAGIYADGVFIGILHEEVIYLKADAATAPAFEREGCTPFTYAAKGGRRTLTSFWRLPERLYDDPDELAGWARTALAVAQRGAAAKQKPSAGGKRKPKPARRSQAT